MSAPRPTLDRPVLPWDECIVGCWTLVLMGPVRRRWGFWRDGRWWFWRDYERVFGFGMRCEPTDTSDDGLREAAL